MQVEMIAVGDEVVKGYTVNSNAAYIAKRMTEYGMNTMYHTAVCDDKSAIKEAVSRALERSDIIFMIGGLGPTEDDMTKEVVCEVVGQVPVLFETHYEAIRAHFDKIGKPMVANNKKQAYFPENSFILVNENGTAPGCIIESNGRFIVLLPGPPKELIPMLENKVIPYFADKYPFQISTTDIRVFDIGESYLAELLKDQLGVFEKYTVATYIGRFEVVVRIRAYGETREEASAINDKIKNEIESRLKENIIGYNDEGLEENVVKVLKHTGSTIACAESCTGGLLAATLINCSGISECLKESIITYSNEAKQKYLDVPEAVLVQYGAVSSQTAKAMAMGIQKQAGSRIGVATTGIAGPDGGTDAKPVGTVYIGIAIDGVCYTHHLQLSGNRQEIREKTVKHLLYKLYRYLLEDNTCNPQIN